MCYTRATYLDFECYIKLDVENNLTEKELEEHFVDNTQTTK